MQLLSSKCRLSTTKNNVTLQFQTENLHRLFYIPVFFFVVILQNEICNIDSKYKKEKKNVIILMANIKASSENSSSDAKYIYGRFLPYPQILYHQMFFFIRDVSKLGFSMYFALLIRSTTSFMYRIIHKTPSKIIFFA